MSINRTIDVESSSSSIVRGCVACKRLAKPPSIYSLRPPPMPPLPLELLSSHAIVFKQAADFDPFVKCKLVTGGSNGLSSGGRPVPLPPPAWPSTNQPPSGLQSFFSLAGLSSLASGIVSSSSSSSSSPTSSPSSPSSYLFVIIVVISVLILFLLLFILFAFVLVYLTKMKLKQSSRTSNDTTSPSSTANHSGSSSANSSGAPSPKDFSHHSSSSSTSSHRVDSNKTVSVFSLSSSSSSCAVSSSSNSPNFIPTVTCYNQLSSPTKTTTNDLNILNR